MARRCIVAVAARNGTMGLDDTTSCEDMSACSTISILIIHLLFFQNQLVTSKNRMCAFTIYGKHCKRIKIISIAAAPGRHYDQLFQQHTYS
jgi:hypothetical protein